MKTATYTFPNMPEHEIPRPNIIQRKGIVLGIVLLYVMLLVAVDVGFIYIARHQDPDSIVLPLIDKTHEHLNTVIRTAFVTQPEQHVFQAPDKQRTATKEANQQQDSSPEEEAIERP